MNVKNTLRRLRRRIISLREEIDNLRQQLDDRDEEMRNDERRTSEQIWAVEQDAKRERNRLQHIADDERSAAQSRKWEYERVARELESAVDWKRITGRDPFGDIERCTQKLRRM